MVFLIPSGMRGGIGNDLPIPPNRNAPYLDWVWSFVVVKSLSF